MLEKNTREESYLVVGTVIITTTWQLNVLNMTKDGLTGFGPKE
jgi:hypothetical protein